MNETENDEQQKQPRKQTRTHASKSKRAVEARRRKIAKAAMEGKSITAAAIATGISPRTAASQAGQILRHPKTQRYFDELLDKAGCTDEHIAKKIQKLTNAQKTVFFPHQGKVIDTRIVEDLSVQSDMVKFAAKVKGHVVDRSEVEVPGIEDIIREIMERRNKTPETR